MNCGYCGKSGLMKVHALEAHWHAEGCPQRRQVWTRVLEARQRGGSGRRILHEAFPRLWPADPMDEAARARIEAIKERRRAEGVHMPTAPRRRKARRSTSSFRTEEATR